MKLTKFVIPLGIGMALIFFARDPLWGQAREENRQGVTSPLVVRPEIITPGQAREITRPREADARPDNIRIHHDPTFIAPFSKTIRTGPESAVRFGLSGWTAPPGRGDGAVARESSGWIALGVSVVWNAPAAPIKPRGIAVAPR